MSTFRMIELPEHRRQLLQLARETAERLLGTVEETAPQKPAIEGRFGGAFVTFWKGETLRGCVGTFTATHDIARTIREVTRSSLNDSRFAANPITAAELGELEIEISILSDPVPTDDPKSLVPGEHGIIVQRGARSGCFLPKVAAERDWSAETFLSNCCTMKAGLAADAWKEAGTEVLLFEAEVFSESQMA